MANIPTIQVLDRGQKGALEREDSIKIKQGHKTETVRVEDFISSRQYAKFGTASDRLQLIATSPSGKSLRVTDSLNHYVRQINPSKTEESNSVFPRAHLSGLGFSISEPTYSPPGTITHYNNLLGGVRESVYTPPHNPLSYHDQGTQWGLWLVFGFDPDTSKPPPPPQTPE